METKRTLLFTDLDGNIIDKVNRELPGLTLNPPKLVMYKNRLFIYTGSGLGRDFPTNFYREVEVHHVQS